MRVIAGTAKGLRLSKVPEGVRPVSDRAREGLFSSLGGRVTGARVLDLYAGSGALAIEAISRGAVAATLVDADPRVVATIRSNLVRTHLEDRATVVRSEVLRFVRGAVQRFDLVFLDPPYDLGSPELDEVLRCLGENLVAPGGTVVLTRGTRSFTPVIPVDWRVAKDLRYGDSLVTLFRPDDRPHDERT